MNPKTIALMILVMASLINTGYSMMATVSVSNSNGCPVYAINDRPVTRTDMKVLLGKLGNLNSDRCIYLLVDGQVSSLSLVTTISDLQNSGLHNLVLICPGIEEGKAGTYELTVDATKRRFEAGCCGEGIESGFREDDLYYRLTGVETQKRFDAFIRKEVAKIVSFRQRCIVAFFGDDTSEIAA